jgi:hypothetical protein
MNFVLFECFPITSVALFFMSDRNILRNLFCGEKKDGVGEADKAKQAVHEWNRRVLHKCTHNYALSYLLENFC